MPPKKRPLPTIEGGSTIPLTPAKTMDRWVIHAKHLLEDNSVMQNLIRSIMAGFFVTLSALFSVLLSAEAPTYGSQLLLQGFGFSAGFFFVLLTGAILFTEVNVIMPTYMIHLPTIEGYKRLLFFWLIAITGNCLGALSMTWIIGHVQQYPPSVMESLNYFIEHKMMYMNEGTMAAWFKIVLSGMLGNWLIGMAAFFSAMGQTIIGKYIPVLLAVSIFVAANFQHSPANVGYFGLANVLGTDYTWTQFILWNLIPAAIGNVLGALVLVVLPLSFIFKRQYLNTL